MKPSKSKEAPQPSTPFTEIMANAKKAKAIEDYKNQLEFVNDRLKYGVITPREAELERAEIDKQITKKAPKPRPRPPQSKKPLTK